MLTIGISWLYITLLCGGMGWVAVEIAGRCIKQRSDVVPLSLLPFLGLSLISAGTAIISLLAPVCWQWNLLFIALLGLGMALLGIERLSHFRLRCLAALSGCPACSLCFAGAFSFSRVPVWSVFMEPESLFFIATLAITTPNQSDGSKSMGWFRDWVICSRLWLSIIFGFSRVPCSVLRPFCPREFTQWVVFLSFGRCFMQQVE